MPEKESGKETKQEKKDIVPNDIDNLYKKIKHDAEDGGYYLNPDEQFAKDLIRGLIVNEIRYGYQSCPCRLSTGSIEKDRDIICPCDYRDADISDYGACYCGLYVGQDILNGTKKLTSIPERRDLTDKVKGSSRKSGKSDNEGVSRKHDGSTKSLTDLKIPVWRCRVCGYLCARENPPEVCPVCKVKKDRFERFL